MSERVTWPDIAAVIELRGGCRIPLSHRGYRRAWHVPSPTGGRLQVNVTLNPRWCTIGVDRIFTTVRDASRADPWFEANIWPHVKQAMRARPARYTGSLPEGASAFAYARPLERAEVPGLLAAWLDAEMTWGLPRDHVTN